MHKLSEDERKRTVWIMGKPYHWELNDEQMLSLKAGPSEHDEIRFKVVDQLINKGVPAEKITKEMIDEVIAKAESAAIMEEMISGGE